MGFLKVKVYVDSSQNLQELENRIRVEISRITPDIIFNVQEECAHRFAYCEENGGWHFEHLIESSSILGFFSKVHDLRNNEFVPQFSRPKT